MSEFTFDGRVAIVTGAGRGLGRAYARLLAARGAKVVVNDLGGSMEGTGTDSGPAKSVADEITAAGGRAVPDTNDVSAPSGAEAIVAGAIEHFGRVDVLVNNAGIIRYGGLPDVDADNLERHLAVHLVGSFNTMKAAWPHFVEREYGRVDVLVNNAGIIRYGGLPDVDADNLERHLAVHLVGSFNTMKAAWPHFVEREYGRVVLTTSSGMFGLDNNLSYAAAKSGMIGMARSAKLAGDPHGIKVNLIAPAAQTRMAGGDPLGEDVRDGAPSIMPPDAVAPMAAYLAHESCPVSGEIYLAGAGRFARVFLAATEGYLHQRGPATIEDVAGHWDEINDEAGYYVPVDLMSWSQSFLKHQFAPSAGSATT